MVPVVAAQWERAESLQQIVPTLAKMNLAGAKFTGYGCPGYGQLLQRPARVGPPHAAAGGLRSRRTAGSGVRSAASSNL